MGFLLPELSTIGYNCAPHYCFQDTQVKKQKQTKQLNPQQTKFQYYNIQHIKQAVLECPWVSTDNTGRYS